MVALLALGSCATQEDSSPIIPHQQRKKGESPTDAAGNYFNSANQPPGTSAAGHGHPVLAPTGSAYEMSRGLTETNSSKAPVLSMNQIAAAFSIARDTRFITDPSRANFARRASWLYPDDGCFARADVTGRELQKLGFKRPSKVFAFGSLEMPTRNSPEGVVYWWYHVALAYRTDSGNLLSQVQVIDPAGKTDAPLSLTEWAGQFSADLSGITFSICAPDAYEPGDDCASPMHSSGKRATHDEHEFLNLEWERQSELGRVPEQVLGDAPPWLR